MLVEHSTLLVEFTIKAWFGFSILGKDQTKLFLCRNPVVVLSVAYFGSPS